MSQLFPTGPLTMDAFMALMPKRELSTSTAEEIEILFGRSSVSPARTYRLPTVAEAMGVPSIQSSVALIAGTTGMLSVQGYQRGKLMVEAPRLLRRPDPYETPQAFYAGSAANMAKHGEAVWYIAAREAGFAASLVNVPLNELMVEENIPDRRRPRYRWGSIYGTRWTPVNPEGQFVHIMYPTGEPMALRGSGPLQLCRAAASVSVEAQAWAAQFYADGGDPSVLIKHAAELSPDLDEDGLSEADRLRAQWVGRPHNVPRIIDQNIESVDYKDPNPNGAQMLEARMHQDGDSARMFRIPGSLLEFSQPGASLTYQNLEGEFTKFIRTCLQPLYLEPIEQALSDLQPRSIVGRFNLKGFLRPDHKTRWEVYQIMVAVLGAEQAAKIAAVEEGIEPGDVEYAPVPFSPSSATPAPIGRYASTELRDVRCPTCARLVVRAAGAVEAWCRHCKAEVREQGEMRALSTPEVITVHVPADDLRLRRIEDVLAMMATREPASLIGENAINLTINPAAAPNVSVTVPAAEYTFPITVEPAPVTVTPPAVEVTNTVEPTPVMVNVEAAQITNHVDVAASEPAQITIRPAPVTVLQEAPRTTRKRVVRDARNQISEIIEESS